MTAIGNVKQMQLWAAQWKHLEMDSSRLSSSLATLVCSAFRLGILIQAVVITLAVALAATSPVVADNKIASTVALSAPLAGAVRNVDASETHGVLVTIDSWGVQIWRTKPTLQFDKTILLPVRNEEQLLEKSVAISPDGRTLAVASTKELVGGKPKFGSAIIYIIDILSGEFSKQQIETDSFAQALKFSPQGDYLAAGLADGCGVRLWRLKKNTSNPRELPTLVEAGRDKVGFSDSGSTGCNAGEEVKRCTLDQKTGRCATSSLAFNPTHKEEHWLAVAAVTGVRVYKKPSSNEGSETLEKRRVWWSQRDETQLIAPHNVTFNKQGNRLLVTDARTIPNQGQPKLFSYNLTQDPAAVIEFTLPDSAYTYSGSNDHLGPAIFTDFGKGDQKRLMIVAGGWTPCQNFKKFADQQANSGSNCIIVWENTAPNNPTILPVGFNTIMHMTAANTAGSSAIRFVTANAIVTGKLHEDASGFSLLEFADQTKKTSTVNLRGSNLIYKNKVYNSFYFSKDMRIAYIKPYINSYEQRRANNPLKDISIYFDEHSISVQPDNYAFSVKNAPLSPIEPPRPEAQTNQICPNQTAVPCWYDSRSFKPHFFGHDIKDVELGKEETSRSVSWREFNQSVTIDNVDTKSEKLALWATSRTVRLIADKGQVLAELPTRTESNRVNLSLSGEIAAVAHNDGVIRWYRLCASSGKFEFEFRLFVSLHLASTNGNLDYVAWLPDGTFHANGIGVADTARLRANALDVAQTIQSKTLREHQGAGNYQKIKSSFIQKCDELKTRNVMLPGAEELHINIVNKPDNRRLDFSEQTTTQDLAIYHKIPGGCHQVRVQFKSFVKGELFLHPAAFEIQNSDTDKAGSETARPNRLVLCGTGTTTVAITIPDSLKTDEHRRFGFLLQLAKENDHLFSFDEVNGHWIGKPIGKQLPHLRAVIVGMANYRGRQDNLPTAQDDALDLSTLLLRLGQLKGNEQVFASVHIHLVIGEAKSKTTYVGDRLRALKAKFGNQLDVHVNFHDDKEHDWQSRFGIECKDEMINAMPKCITREALKDDRIANLSENDLFLFHFSGHGLAIQHNEKLKQIMLLPQSKIGDLDSINEKSISPSSFREHFKNIKSNTLFVVDACRERTNRDKANDFHPLYNAMHYTHNRRGMMFLPTTKAPFRSYDQTFMSFGDAFFSDGGQRQQTGNGLLTLAFMLATVCAQEKPEDRDISVRQIDQYVSDFFKGKNNDLVLKTVQEYASRGKRISAQHFSFGVEQGAHFNRDITISNTFEFNKLLNGKSCQQFILDVINKQRPR